MVNKPSVQALSFRSQKKKRNHAPHPKKPGRTILFKRSEENKTVDPIQTAGEVDLIEAESMEVFEGGGRSEYRGPGE
jgi:hypothetical protein